MQPDDTHIGLQNITQPGQPINTKLSGKRLTHSRYCSRFFKRWIGIPRETGLYLQRQTASCDRRHVADKTGQSENIHFNHNHCNQCGDHQNNQAQQIQNAVYYMYPHLRHISVCPVKLFSTSVHISPNSARKFRS